MSSSLLNVITYYQRSIEKNGHDEKRLLHCIEKLYKLPVSLEHLQATGVGKTVNSLRKFDKEVGVAAKALVAKWKAMVAAEAQVVEEDEDEDTQSEPHDDDPNGNSQENTNTLTNSRNNCLNDVNDNHRSHSQHRNESPSSSNKEKRQNPPEMCNKSKLQGNKSHSSHSSSRYKSDEYKNCKLNSGSSKKEDQKKRRRRDEHSHSKPKESDSDSQTEEKSVSKLSIVEEIEHDFEVLVDDDDEEKLIIDVSKEKTEEIERKSKSEPRHHSSKDNAKKESSRSKENSRKENSYSKEKHSKESRRHEDSRKDSSSSKESTRKENSGTKESSHREHNSRNDSYSNENSRKDRHHREKDREKSERKNRKYRGKSEESHKSRHSEPRDKESKRKDEEQQSSSSHTSNGEHHKSKHKDKDKNQERDSREKSKELKRRNNSDSESKSTESSPTKAKIPKILVDGIDSSMGTSFEDALGMISASSSAKKALKTSPKVIATNSVTSSHGIFAKPSSRSPIRSKTPPLLATAVKLEPLDPNITLDLPTISPNYKPLPLNPIVMECVFSTNKPPQKPQRLFNDEEAMSAGISSKTIRTKVYSGAKLGAVYQVQSLFDLCIRVLQKNIDGLEYTGGVPFDVLKPVLERATPQQLVTFEEYNPYLMEDSDILWQQHCIRYYRGHKRLEMETWREMFFRCKEEQDRKLNMLAENIKQSQMQIQLPVRKTQLAYVDSMVKPPRNVIRKQEQYGTKSNLTATPAARVAALCNITPNASKAGDFRLKAAASSPDTLQIATANNGRPKKAPLMQKTIKFMKGRFKR